MRDPDPSDAVVLEAAAAVVEDAARRRAVFEALAVATGFLLLLVATGLAAVLHPAAPLLVLAAGIAAGARLVDRLANDPGDPTPPAGESLPR